MDEKELMTRLSARADWDGVSAHVMHPRCWITVTA
jgi:hypothetical protein